MTLELMHARFRGETNAHLLGIVQKFAEVEKPAPVEEKVSEATATTAKGPTIDQLMEAQKKFEESFAHTEGKS